MTVGSNKVQQRAYRRRLIAFAMVLGVLLALAVLWGSSPMKALMDIDTLVEIIRQKGQQVGPVLAVCAFTVAVSVAVPLSFLTLLAMVALGPVSGFVCTVAGAVLGATASYLVGSWLGRPAIERLGGERLNDLSRRLGSKGLRAVIAVRLIPVAPFAVVNMLAGATHIRLRDLLLGTLIGMMPMTLTMVFFTEHMLAALKNPNTSSVLMLGLTVLAIVIAAWAVRRWMRDMR